MSITREEIVAELRNAALIEALSKPPRSEPPTGTDGAETCQKCSEQLREHKLADQMRRNKAFSAGEVEVARYYCRQAAVAISQGKTKASVWGEETERITGQSPATATRLHKAYEAFQDDPEIAPTLPFRIEKVTRDRKDHIEIVVTAVPDDPAERTTAGMLAKLTPLHRPDSRGAHGGPRDACPKCQSPMTRTTYDVCQNAECGHMVTHPSKTVGRTPFHDETDSPPVKIGGDLYAVEVRGERPFHDEIKGVRTYSKQDETVPSRPISFVSRDDQITLGRPQAVHGARTLAEDAAGDRDTLGTCPRCDEYSVWETRSGVTRCTACSETVDLGEAVLGPPRPPESRPIVTAPRSHAAYWSRPGWRERAQAAARGTGRASPPAPTGTDERSRDERR